MQIPLDIKLNDIYSFDSFVVGDNSDVVTCLQGLKEDAVSRFVYLHAPSGSGKTHLLQALCRETTKAQHSVLYLSLTDKSSLDVNVLENAETLALVVLDDIGAIVADRQWEEAVFHFYNRARDSGNVRVVMAGHEHPAGLGLSLADLQSRLLWGLVFSLRSLDDKSKVQALKLRANNRGLEMPDDVGEYLLKHCPRDLSYLMDLLDRLDKASLVSKRKITVPFLKTVLDD